MCPVPCGALAGPEVGCKSSKARKQRGHSGESRERRGLTTGCTVQMAATWGVPARGRSSLEEAGGGVWFCCQVFPALSPPPDAWASTQETTGACNMAILQAGCLDMGYGKHTVTHQNTAPPPTPPIPSTHSDSKNGWRVHRVAASSTLHLEKWRWGRRAPVYKVVNPFMVPGG